MIPKFAALILILCASASFAAEPLLPNGIRGLKLGMTGAQAAATVKTLWPQVRWECSPWFEADIENCWGLETAVGDISYGGRPAYAARLAIQRGILVQVQLEFGTNIAAQTYGELTRSLTDVTSREPRNIAKNGWVRKFWTSPSELIFLTNDSDSTSFSYVTIPFRVQQAKNESLVLQRAKGM